MRVKYLILSSLFLFSCSTKIKQIPCSKELYIEIRKIDTSCNSRDGQIIVQVSGGVKPYLFKWKHDSNLNSDNIAGLKSGLYEVVVSDQSNKKTISQIIIN